MSDAIQEHFRAFVIGGADSGKAKLLINLIGKYHAKYERFIICTDSPNSQILEYADDRFIITDKIESLGTVEEYGYEHRTLVIFDGVNYNNSDSRNIVTQFIIKSRRYNMSTIITSQSYCAIPKIIRLQATIFYLTSIYSKRDIKSLINDFGLDITYDDVTKNIMTALVVNVIENAKYARSLIFYPLSDNY